MKIRVIIPPDPIVDPSDIAGDHADDDAAVSGMIAAVQSTIDGPTGWLGRSLGPQTLEMSFESFCHREIALRYGPVISIDSITYLDAEEVEQYVSDSDWRQVGDAVLFRSAFAFPSTACAPDAVRIRYQAGYDGEDVDGGGTGDVPEQARQAIILSVQHMASLDVESLYLRVDEVEGVGRREFTLSDQASSLIQRVCDRLLDTLRVFV